MKFKTAILSLSLSGVAALVFVSGVGGFGSAAAQQGSVTWDKPAPAGQPKPKPRAPRRRPAPARPKEEPLMVEWRVYKQKGGDDATLVETNPAAVFHDGDLLRFTVKTNYDGYLYVIHQGEGQDARLIVPDSRVREGQNFLSRAQEYALPAPVCTLPNPLNCFYKVGDKPGRDSFTVIFSRALVPALPEQVSLSGGVVKQPDLNKLIVSSVESIRVGNCRAPIAAAAATSPAGGAAPSAAPSAASPYALCVTNTNARANETLIFSLPVNRS